MTVWMHINHPFYGFLTSPPPVGNNTLYFILFYFSSLSVSTILPYSECFDSDLPAPKFWPGIWRWWITAFFSYTVLSLLPLSFMLFCVSCIMTGNETEITSDVLGSSLDIFGTIIYILNCSPSIPIIKELFSVIIEAFIVCGNDWFQLASL